MKARFYDPDVPDLEETVNVLKNLGAAFTAAAAAAVEATANLRAQLCELDDLVEIDGEIHRLGIKREDPTE